MMKNLNTKTISVLIMLLVTVWGEVASAAPADQNFDSAGVGDKGSQSYTLSGVTYTTNDSGALNISVVNDGNIASGGDLAYRIPLLGSEQYHPSHLPIGD